MTTPAPTVLGGRYQLHQAIGAGGMAHVYRGRDLLLDRDVAIKVLRPELAADPDILHRFQQEARRAAGLAHPNVVAVYDVGIGALDEPEPAGAAPYIVMELVEGDTLKDLVQRGPLPPLHAVRLCLQMLSALEAAHRRGIVHRDVKAQNVLVTPAGVVKVTDFGIAAEAGALGDPGSDRVLATAQYCSPEQAMGRAATPASDIYGVGVVLYELLTGRLPFPGHDPQRVARQQVERPPVPPREINRRIPPQLEAIVLRALAKDPGDRYPNAEAMAAALRDWLGTFAERTTQLTPIPAPAPGVDARTPRTGATTRLRPQPAHPVRQATIAPAERGRATTRRSEPRERRSAPGFNWVLVLLGLAIFACALAAYGGSQLYAGLARNVGGLRNPLSSLPPLPGPADLRSWLDRGATPNPAPTTAPTAAPTPRPTQPPTPQPTVRPTNTPAPALPPPSPTRPPATATTPPTPTARPASPTPAPAVPTPPPPPTPTAIVAIAGRFHVLGLDSQRQEDGGPYSGEIRGVVVDANKRPVNGLRFRIREIHGGWSAEFPSGANRSTDGTWWFAGLSSGTYLVTALDPVSGAEYQSPPLAIFSPPRAREEFNRWRLELMLIR